MSIKQFIYSDLSLSTQHKKNRTDELSFLIAQINVRLSRANYSRVSRLIDTSNPISWEFRGFSQNNEDGLIEYILNNVKEPNYYFVEIGSSDGSENNSSLLAFGKNYGGLMIEGNVRKSNLCKELFSRLSTPYIECLNLFVNIDNARDLMKNIVYKDPDLFSIDIDGNDFHVLKCMLENNFRPKLIVVEYNASFGDILSVTIPYSINFEWGEKHGWYYYGASISAWRKLLESYNYTFITVESAGSNALFVDMDKFQCFLPSNFKPLNFIDNKACLLRDRKIWRDRLAEVNTNKLLHIE